MGLGWDAAKKHGLWRLLRGGGVDLDASCILFDDLPRQVDAVWFQHLQSQDGSVRHMGDNLTGAGNGDDERIIVDLACVPQHVTSLVFLVTSFSGEPLNRVANAFCHLVDSRTGSEVARYDLSNLKGRHTATVMARVYRHSGEWQMQAIGEPAYDRTFYDLVPVVRAVLHSATFR